MGCGQGCDTGGHGAAPTLPEPFAPEGLMALLQRLPTAESDRDREQNQAATWNSSAMKPAWARMSRLPMPRTCPFLIIAIAS